MIINVKNVHRSLFEISAKNFLFIIFILMNSIPAVELFNCPLLHSFMNDTGVLAFNKTAMLHTEPTIHCQWLVVGSKQQVVEF